MVQRRYDQPCSLAQALDSIGGRWTMLIVRELLLGPLRFSDLARAVGGAPTDVLTKRLRTLEGDGIVARRELPAPASATVYELTDLGRALERPLVELARWGLNFQRAADVAELPPSLAANALRVILQPPADARLSVQLEMDGESFVLDLGEGRIAARRGRVEAPDLTLTGAPLDVFGMIADVPWPGGEMRGSEAALLALREMVEVPDRLREEMAEVAVR